MENLEEGCCLQIVVLDTHMFGCSQTYNSQLSISDSLLWTKIVFVVSAMIVVVSVEIKVRISFVEHQVSNLVHKIWEESKRNCSY